MPDAGFPLPSSSYKELIKIIQGYGRIGSEASLSDVSHLTAIGETIVSANNKFLVAIGVISGGKKKTITSLGAELAIALQHDLTDEIAAKWRAIVDGSDFLQKVTAAVRIRKGMDESSLESHVAYSAAQPKTPAVATGASTVVEILKAANLLKDEAGNLIAVAQEPPSIPATVERSLTIGESKLPEDFTHAAGRAFEVRAAAYRGGVNLNIDVRVQCTPGDLEGLGSKLRKVIDDFNAPPGPAGGDSSKD